MEIEIKKQILLLFLFCLVRCKSNFALDGDYKKVSSDFSYSLQLRKDSAFIIKKGCNEANAICEGKWKVNTSKAVVLDMQN